MTDFRSLVLRAGSIRAAARLLHVSPRAVSRWYAGREVPPGVAERLAAELGPEVLQLEPQRPTRVH